VSETVVRDCHHWWACGEPHVRACGDAYARELHEGLRAGASSGSHGSGPSLPVIAGEVQRAPGRAGRRTATRADPG